MTGPRIYTRAGDKGTTSLIGGTRISKADWRLEAYGTVDELNSAMGLAQAELKGLTGPATSSNLLQNIERIQGELFTLGSQLACESEKLRAKLPTLQVSVITRLETEIDTATDQLPKLTQFVLPGGTRTAGALHLARAICRRAERQCVRFLDEVPDEKPTWELSIHYLNRLSDWLFTMARFSLHLEGQADQIWTGK